MARHAWTGQDRRVTESQSPLDAALDLLVYAPVGLALTAAEETVGAVLRRAPRLAGQRLTTDVVYWVSWPPHPEGDQLAGHPVMRLDAVLPVGLRQAREEAA